MRYLIVVITYNICKKLDNLQLSMKCIPKEISLYSIPCVVKKNVMPPMMYALVHSQGFGDYCCGRNGCRCRYPCEIEEVCRGAMSYWIVFHYYSGGALIHKHFQMMVKGNFASPLVLNKITNVCVGWDGLRIWQWVMLPHTRSKG